jgi:hypothetical protein
MILMNSSFVFDKDTHMTYADVSASELPTGNGYTAGGLTLSGITRTTDNTEDRCEVTWDAAQWNADTGSLTTSGAIIYMVNATPDAVVEKVNPIVSYKGDGTILTATAGQPLIISAIMETVEDL